MKKIVIGTSLVLLALSPAFEREGPARRAAGEVRLADVRNPRRAGVPQHRPRADVRPDQRYRHPPPEPEDLVRRRGLRRRLEDRERRPELEADLRRPGLLFHRLCHPRPRKSGDRLGRDGRERQRPPCRLRRRRVQEPERRHRPGRTWASRPPSTSPGSSSIRATPPIVYVAAEGPLWSPGGERGLFKSVDGGKTWKTIPRDLQGHGSRQRRVRSFESGHPLRGGLSEAEVRGRFHGRRARIRDLQERGRRA